MCGVAGSRHAVSAQPPIHRTTPGPRRQGRACWGRGVPAGSGTEHRPIRVPPSRRAGACGVVSSYLGWLSKDISTFGSVTFWQLSGTLVSWVRLHLMGVGRQPARLVVAANQLLGAENAAGTFGTNMLPARCTDAGGSEHGPSSVGLEQRASGEKMPRDSRPAQQPWLQLVQFVRQEPTRCLSSGHEVLNSNQGELHAPEGPAAPRLRCFVCLQLPSCPGGGELRTACLRDRQGGTAQLSQTLCLGVRSLCLGPRGRPTPQPLQSRLAGTPKPSLG